MQELPRCKNCKFWEDGKCQAVNCCDEGFGWSQNPDILFEIEYEVDDNSGLWLGLKTGPEFGCVRFEKK